MKRGKLFLISLLFVMLFSVGFVFGVELLPGEPVAVERIVDGGDVRLEIVVDSESLADNEILIISDTFLGEVYLNRFGEISPDFLGFQSIGWLFAKNPVQILGEKEIEVSIPVSIDYEVNSDVLITDFKGKWGLKEMGVEGSIIACYIEGDVNRDNFVDELDEEIVVDKMMNDCIGYDNWCDGADMSQDGHVNAFDLAILRRNSRSGCNYTEWAIGDGAGSDWCNWADATRDGVVNAFDLAKLRQGTSHPDSGNCKISEMCSIVDINNDKTVDSDDLNLVRANQGNDCSDALPTLRFEFWLIIGIIILIFVIIFILSRKKTKKTKRRISKKRR